MDRRIVQKGRGAASNPSGRFDRHVHIAADDGWGILDEPVAATPTTVEPDAARSIIARNRSPDIPFSQSINPYRGCEHGCIYCYARPSHSALGLSPGLDFEARLFYKRDAAALLEKALASPGYRCSPIALGANTDPYQPIEKDLGITRSILETLSAAQHPVTIVTKGAAIMERDIGLLSDMARRRLVAVYISITTLDRGLKRRLEPRAAGAGTRLALLERLSEAGVPAGVMVAPVIPALTDHELEGILEAAARVGAKGAGYVMLRLPYEVKALFTEWLETHEPLKAGRVMSRIRDLRGGKDNDARFGSRQRGEGEFARLFERRFERACRKLGLDRGPGPSLDTGSFIPPARVRPQLDLF